MVEGSLKAGGAGSLVVDVVKEFLDDPLPFVFLGSPGVIGPDVMESLFAGHRV